ncbi:CGNR zinc finger domain-containing protein [Catenuloplanes indicus]|uniref:RNA-binding Zn ribbon-like protein n=1 Tax=Catenuloplanes indicus TaxID=137267 RepID=A0AAE4AVZ3_9ACTN|nr:CGNR zinc finger domain-containing protein [Catenuloplanes indicus]MDQ0364186.1 putative RNA-binding Zn ribbon-like protein [Catenuloplanes indicus]
MADTAFLLTLLNTAPVIDGVRTDRLDEAWPELPDAGRRALRTARDLLQDVVRGRRPATALAPLLDGVRSVPSVTADGVVWAIDADGARALVVEAVLAWDELRRAAPGRLRPCANDECELFLLDRSKSNSARWCSMATCGNKLKARRHYERARRTAE